jgi:hypothetical protein
VAESSKRKRKKKERKRKEQILDTRTSTIEVEERLDCLLYISKLTCFLGLRAVDPRATIAQVAKNTLTRD